MPGSLLNGLGGPSGFGENFLARNDDNSTGLIDLRTIFGSAGLNFFGQTYTGLYLNNNGSVSFAAPISQYTPTAITGSTTNPIIAAFWADVDTRGGVVTATPGGASTGSDLLWYDLDPTTKTFTATWDDVGYYSVKTNKLNAFQLSLTQVNSNGDFNITFRYENIDWTTGDVSGGSNGLGGTVAHAGYSSGNGINYYEMPQSGNQAGMLDLENTSNVGSAGVYTFQIRSGTATPTISINNVSVLEGNGGTPNFAILTVTLAAASSQSITVAYATADGTALAGQDYVGQAGILTFAAGVTQQYIVVEIIGDNVVESNETFSVHLSNAVGAPLGNADGTVTILNDDGLSISDVTQLEGTGSGTTAFVFTISLGSAQATPVTVNYASENGTAIAGSDFTAINGALTFAAGETSKSVTVLVNADSTFEPDETFDVRLSSPSGAQIAKAVGVGTILNDDGLTIDDATVVEGTSTTNTNALVTIRLATAATQLVSVNWATEPGTATAGIDYVSSNGTVTFAVGETSKVITIPVVADSVVEPTETFQVRLSGATGTGIIDDVGVVRILDDDGLSVNDVAVNEGNSGTTNVVFTVSLGSALSTPVTVNYATANGTATAGSDYTAVSGTLTFAAGETSKSVTVAVNGDLLPEADETFSLVLSNPSAATGILRGTGVATIYNDDGLSIADASVTEGNSGTTNVTVTVSLSGPATVPVTVNYATQDGTATAGLDYVAASGTLSFAVGETTKQITLAVNGDTIYEGNETFRVVLSSPAGTSIVDGFGTVTIVNDDAAPPASLRIVDAAVAEGTGPGDTVMRFLVTLSAAQVSAVTVNYATSNGTAIAGSDYTATSGTLTIAAGSLYGIIEVPITRDSGIEPNESFTVTLSAPSGGLALATASATGTILNDDVTFVIAAANADQAEGQSGATPFTFTVTRTGDSSLVQTIDWTVTGSGANPANNADFSGYGGSFPSGTVSFAAGETTKTITVNVAGDLTVENDEGFTVTLSNPSSGGVILTSSAAGVIRNDDVSGPVLSIAATDADKAEGQSGSTPFFFSVTRAGDISGASTASWAVSGAAVNGADFVGGALPSGTVSFAAGQGTQAIIVNVAGDVTLESDEAFTVTLSNPSSGSISTASATGVIRNDDQPAITPPFTDGPDVLTLTIPGQSWHAGGGDDKVFGSPGADAIYGDAGNDTLTGGDELRLSAAQQSIYRLYGATLNREPDLPGLNGWMNFLAGGMSLTTIASGFVASAEFQSTYGALNNTQFVTLLYNNVLRRAPDAPGLSGWLSLLAAGMSREAVVTGFSESAEYQGNMALPSSAYATTVVYGATFGEVYRLYGATLNREPDSAGFAGWVDILAGGQTLSGIAGGFVGSTEFQNAYGGLDNAGFVTLLYNNVLHRTPDPAGLSGWLNLMSSGMTRETVVTGFSESTEYQGNTAAGLRTFMQTKMTQWADTLNGGAGDDVLFGGRGADTFQFDKLSPGNDQIYGFESWDTLNMTNFGYASAAAATSHMTQAGADVVFSDQGETITFKNSTMAVVTAASFTFA